MFSPNGKSSEYNVANFEQEIGFSLPDDYRSFIMDKNGGTCQGGVISQAAPGDFLVDCLFGLVSKDEMSLRFWFQELNGEIPEKSLIIGSDAGGGFLLLCMKKGMEGIYYYDHSYLFPTSNDDMNTYFVCSSFSELFSELRIV